MPSDNDICILVLMLMPATRYFLQSCAYPNNKILDEGFCHFCSFFVLQYSYDVFLQMSPYSVHHFSQAHKNRNQSYLIKKRRWGIHMYLHLFLSHVGLAFIEYYDALWVLSLVFVKKWKLLLCGQFQTAPINHKEISSI